MTNVVAVSTWFPTSRSPSRGAFVVRDVQAIAQHADIRLVHLVPPHDDDGTRHTVHEGIDVLRIPMDPKRPDSLVRAARALARAVRGADLVHTMAISSLLPFAVLRPDAPWVHTEHWSGLTTPATLSAPLRAGLPVISRLLRRPDHVTAVCEYLASPIRRLRGSERPTSIVPCIVEPHPLKPRRGREDGTLRLVSTGGLIPRKDPIVAVRTVDELRRRGVDARLQWLGDGPLRAEVSQLISELGLDAVVDLAGSRTSVEVRQALADSDMFFGPTRADNFFVSAAEALVAGRPVVLGATGGQGEYTKPEVGSLISTQDPILYADAVQDLDVRTEKLSSEEISATIGDAFSSETVGKKYYAVYQEALTEGKS